MVQSIEISFIQHRFLVHVKIIGDARFHIDQLYVVLPLYLKSQ